MVLYSLLSAAAQSRRVYQGPLTLGETVASARSHRLVLTSDLLLQAEDDSHGLVQDQELGLGLIALEVELHHAAELLESLIDVTDP